MPPIADTKKPPPLGQRPFYPVRPPPSTSRLGLLMNCLQFTRRFWVHPIEKGGYFCVAYMQKYGRIPLFLLAIFLLELVLFGSRSLIGGNLNIDLAFAYNPCKRLQLWRFFTYYFLRKDTLFHLKNALVLLLLGFPLEILHGSKPFVVMYFGAIFSGSLFSSAVRPEEGLYYAEPFQRAIWGAVLGNMIVHIPHYRFANVHLIILLGCTLSAVTELLYLPHAWAISNFASAVTGLLLALYYFGNNPQFDEKRILWKSLLGFCAVVVLAVGWGGAIAMHLFDSDHFVDASSNGRFCSNFTAMFAYNFEMHNCPYCCSEYILRTN